MIFPVLGDITNRPNSPRNQIKSSVSNELVKNSIDATMVEKAAAKLKIPRELAIATWVAEEVKSCDIISLNAVTPDEELIVSEEQIEEYMIVSDNFNLRQQMINFSSDSLFEKMRETAVISKEEHFGNCGAKSSVALDALIRRYPEADTKFEIFSITNGQHQFIVIGRDPKSDIADYKTWGPNAYVVDTWANAVYPASQIPVKLHDFTMRDEGANTILGSKLFDPGKQSLSLVLSNLFNSNEVENLTPAQKHF